MSMRVFFAFLLIGFFVHRAGSDKPVVRDRSEMSEEEIKVEAKAYALKNVASNDLRIIMFESGKDKGKGMNMILTGPVGNIGKEDLSNVTIRWEYKIENGPTQSGTYSLGALKAGENRKIEKVIGSPSLSKYGLVRYEQFWNIESARF